MSRDPPFFAGSILGLRAWVVQVRLPSSATRLASTFAEADWEPGGAWTEAVCAAPGGRRRRHSAPRAGCSCGLYAWHPREDVAERLYEEHVGLWAGSELSDPRAFLETAGVLGLVEASGRIEVHRDGFRAERARPVAFAAGPKWTADDRAGLEELAALYGAEVLEASGHEAVLAYARERGGVLSESQITDLVGEEPDAQVASPRSPGPTAPTVPIGSPPRTLGDKLRSIAQAAFTGAVAIVAGLFYLFFWGGIAAGVVMAAGNILFRWFDTEPQPRPAKIVALQMDRERCVLRATVDSRKNLEHLNVVVSGNLRNGDSLGHHRFKLGRLPRGRSQVVVAHPDPRLCRSRHNFTIRVRPRWGELKGTVAETRSRFEPAVRNRAPSATQEEE